MIKVNRRLDPYRWRVGFVLVLIVASTISSSVPPIMAGKIIDYAIPNKDVSILSFLTLGILIMRGLQRAFFASSQYMISLIILKVSRDLRLDMFRSLLRTNTSFFTTTQRGDILQRCIDDAEALQVFSQETLPQFIQELFSAVFAFIIILWLCWPLALLSVVICILYLFPLGYFGKLKRRLSTELSQQNAVVQQLLQENIESIRLIKTFGTEEIEYQRVYKEQEKWAQLVFRRYVTDNLFRTFPRMFDALAPALVFIVVGWQIFHGALTIGIIITIVGLLPSINAPIRSSSATFMALKEVSARLERVLEYLELPAEPGLAVNLQKIQNIQGNIEFRNVIVDTERGRVLDAVSFSIQPGEHVALVGISGSGKSTIIRLLTRFIEPTAGSISIDGYPLCNMDASDLRQRLGIVAQENFLFNESILNNIRYGHNISQDDIERLSEEIGSHSFIITLTGGYATLVGERGVVLSGGQKQYISILRALVNNPDVLLLDEATSALDQPSEAQIYRTIRKLAAGRTCIFVTHRLQTVVNADRIIVLHRGQLVEEGNHFDLLKREGLYAQLWQSQAKEGVLIDEYTV